MDVCDMQRKIQFRQGSYVVTIPLQIVHALGIRRDQYVRFAVSKGKIIIKPVDPNMAKKDVAEADRDSASLDRYGSGQGSKEGGFEEDLAAALKNDGMGRKAGGPGGGASRLEKLRM